MPPKKVKEVPGCSGCPMQAVHFKFEDENGKEVEWIGSEQNFVAPQLGPSLRLALAEAPGEQEALEGTPLVGGSGRVMNMLWGKAGIKRESLTVLNCINCRPPNNVYPTDPAARKYISAKDADAAVQQCYRNHVEPVLNSRPWTRFDAIGEKSLRTLTGKTDGIMKWRGSPLKRIGQDKETVIGIVHPAFLMRKQELIPIAISDLKKGTDVPPEYYNLRPTIEELQDFHADTLCFDIETNMGTGAITMVGFSVRPHHVIVVPYRGAYIGEIHRILGEASQLIGQNIIGFDIPVLKKNGVKFREDLQVWDTMLLHHLMQPDNKHDLEFISSVFTQKPAWKHLNNENMALYCARDVDVTLQSFLQLKPLVQMYGMMDLYKYCQVPLTKICKLMSDAGVKRDGARLVELKEKFTKELAELEATLPEELRPYDKPTKKRVPAPAGTLGKSGKPVKFIHIPSSKRVVPWASPDVVSKYLYETLKLPEQYHPKTKELTSDKNALERLFKKTQRPELDAIRKVRSLDEIITTFLKEDEDEVKQDGIVHSSFLPHGTNTGRLSSSGPNMQNITPKAKYMYVPKHKGWCFVEADFSSLENTFAAYFANDEDRLRRMNTLGFNEHRWLANQIYGIPEEEIDKKSWQYDRAKHTNHGADAGMGPRKMSLQYGVPEKDCKELLYMWRKLNRKSAEWQDQCGNKAVKEGMLINPFSRHRWFWNQSAYTEGIRMMLQGSGADVCIRSMIALVYERIEWPEEFVLKVSGVLAPLPKPAELVLQVHDSLLVECPENLVDECIEQMKKAMTQPWRELGGFQFKVAFKVGEPDASWGELEERK
jgi:uracil-DNA glycosylase family 4